MQQRQHVGQLGQPGDGRCLLTCDPAVVEDVDGATDQVGQHNRARELSVRADGVGAAVVILLKPWPDDVTTRHLPAVRIEDQRVCGNPSEAGLFR